MDYRPLEPDEEPAAGDWWVHVPTGPDDRMTFSAPNWFIHPTMGRCFRIEASQTKTISDWMWCGLTDATGLFRDVEEDF